MIATNRKTRYETLRPCELEQIIDTAPIAYFPIGSMEYHGPHLPFGFDALHAHSLCLAAAEETGGAVLPATYWGTEGHVGWPGSLLVGNGTMVSVVSDVLDRLADQSFELIVVCTGHYPAVQGAMIDQICQARRKPAFEPTLLAVDPFNLHPTDTHSEHAGIIETSIMLHLAPELVDMSALEQPGALEGITEDAPEASAEYGARRFGEVLGALVERVRKTFNNMRESSG